MSARERKGEQAEMHGQVADPSDQKNLTVVDAMQAGQKRKGKKRMR